jgi:non-homologous end joining protein Ku
VIRGGEQLVLLRPLKGLLALSGPTYDRQIVAPDTFANQLPAGDVQDEELELAHTLIEAATAETFDYSGYRDTHHERLEQLIEAKLAGRTGGGAAAR